MRRNDFWRSYNDEKENCTTTYPRYPPDNNLVDKGFLVTQKILTDRSYLGKDDFNKILINEGEKQGLRPSSSTPLMYVCGT